MVQINWTHQALFDLKEIKDFISRDSSLYAKRTILKIKNSTQILKKYPNSGKVIPEVGVNNYREIEVGSFRIFYKIVSEDRFDISNLSSGVYFVNIITSSWVKNAKFVKN